MTEQDEHNPSLEEHALINFTLYFELSQEGSKYDNRWAKLQSSVLDKDVFAVNEMVRNACVEMFKQGFLLRLTGE